MLDTTDVDPHSEPPSEEMTATRRSPLRFSLGTLFLLVTLVALLTALWKTSRETWQLRNEVRKLRQECGYLTISDPNKVHVIGVRRLGSLKWAWRIYLPEKRQFRLHHATRQIPTTGFPKIGGSGSLSRSREFLLDAGIEKNARGQWVLSLQMPGSGSWGSMDSWAERSYSSNSEGVSVSETRVVEPGQPVVLLRYRVREENPQVNPVLQQPPQGPADGLMLWIEEVPPPSTR